ncbi:hypothetical protein TTHERM_00802480 (macronuclear) [Tetrahymena thermophila SB210]|uniref:Uncharacterized protein n=1 Tax=Tetrahymena thermophila (strain SB210) TaxID=312017 RepID=Q235F3_TETTS|nr:hypothetical protein TTHERM_00802480 [Tetrahymena thermophila SB210]EAR92150.1 hypothetical protein TTHERM_00802480 [Tetrahymena thermophila SB210]|eukprot:XP_001012395.1 hypothetical protein TTHERM_00802480 [Tetrahymena thermophila SB210]
MEKISFEKQAISQYQQRTFYLHPPIELQLKGFILIINSSQQQEPFLDYPGNFETVELDCIGEQETQKENNSYDQIYSLYENVHQNVKIESSQSFQIPQSEDRNNYQDQNLRFKSTISCDEQK